MPRTPCEFTSKSQSLWLVHFISGNDWVLLVKCHRLFPQGLKPLREQFGDLMLYMVNFCPNNTYLHPEDAAASFPNSFSFLGAPHPDTYFVNPKAAASEAACESLSFLSFSVSNSGRRSGSPVCHLPALATHL